MTMSAFVSLSVLCFDGLGLLQFGYFLLDLVASSNLWDFCPIMSIITREIYSTTDKSHTNVIPRENYRSSVAGNPSAE